MRQCIIIVTALLVSLLWAGESAIAQSRGGTFSFGRSSGSGSSGFGSSALGGSGFGGMGGGSAMGGFGGGFGSSGFGSSGIGGFGNSGFGTSSFGVNGFGVNGFGGSGYGGQGGGASFVGRDAVDMQSTFLQSNRASTQFFNNMNRQMARQSRENRKQAVTSINPPQPMRMEVKTAFNAPRPSSEAVANGLRARISRILADHRMSQPVITMEGDTAVLSGVAASDSERMVIGQLVALEQGVRAVRNEMTVAADANAAVNAN